MKLTPKKKWKWATRDGEEDEVYFWTHKPSFQYHGWAEKGWWATNENSECEWANFNDVLTHDLKPGECRRINK